MKRGQTFCPCDIDVNELNSLRHVTGAKFTPSLCCVTLKVSVHCNMPPLHFVLSPHQTPMLLQVSLYDQNMIFPVPHVDAMMSLPRDPFLLGRSVIVWQTKSRRSIRTVLFTVMSVSQIKLVFVRFQCFKAAWMTTVLHQGFKFPQNYSNLRSAFYIGDKEVQWTLGAILYRTRFLPLR